MRLLSLKAFHSGDLILSLRPQLNGVPAGPEFQLQRDCSEQTAREIDEEVKKLLDRCYAEAKEILSLHRDQHEQITAELLRHETIDGPRFYQLIGREILRPKELEPPMALAAAASDHGAEQQGA